MTIYINIVILNDILIRQGRKTNVASIYTLQRRNRNVAKL